MIPRLEVHLSQPITPSDSCWPSKEVVRNYKISQREHVRCKYTLNVSITQTSPGIRADLSKEQLGSGAYATVYRCTNTINGSQYALKKIKKKKMVGREQLVQKEFQVLKRLDSPHTLRLVDYFESDNHLYVVTNLASGGELFDRILEGGSFFEGDVIRITRSILEGVDYLHTNNIVHRDLKAENILFKSRDPHSDLIIADFGLAEILNDPQIARTHNLNACGTLSYMAPELVLKQKSHGFPVDIWSLGVLTYFMLCGYMPFDCETDDETRQAITTVDYSFDSAAEWDHISDMAKDFIRNCLVLSPEGRMTASQALEHPFLSKDTELEETSFNLLPAVKSNISVHGMGGGEMQTTLAVPALSTIVSPIGISPLVTPAAEKERLDYFQGKSSAELNEVLLDIEKQRDVFQVDQEDIPMELENQLLPFQSNSTSKIALITPPATAETLNVDDNSWMNGALCFSLDV